MTKEMNDSIVPDGFEPHEYVITNGVKTWTKGYDLVERNGNLYPKDWDYQLTINSLEKEIDRLEEEVERLTRINQQIFSLVKDIAV